MEMKEVRAIPIGEVTPTATAPAVTMKDNIKIFVNVSLKSKNTIEKEAKKFLFLKIISLISQNLPKLDSFELQC